MNMKFEEIAMTTSQLNKIQVELKSLFPRHFFCVHFRYKVAPTRRQKP